MGKKNILFDEDEEVAPSQLKVNEDFAKRFEVRILEKCPGMRLYSAR